MGATRRLRQPIRLPSWHHGSSCGAPCTLAPEADAVAGRCVNRIGKDYSVCLVVAHGASANRVLPAHCHLAAQSLNGVVASCRLADKPSPVVNARGVQSVLRRMIKLNGTVNATIAPCIFQDVPPRALSRLPPAKA